MAEVTMKSRSVPVVREVDVLVAGGALDEDTVLGTIADQFGLKYCHIDADAISPDVTKVVTDEIARKYAVVPVVAVLLATFVL